MKNLNEFNQYRIENRFGFLGNERVGQFFIPMRGVIYQVVATTGEGWDHVSVSILYGKEGKRQARIPSYEEMQIVKDMFFKKDEPVIEIHPKKADYVNQNEYVLHLWRPLNSNLPLPPEVSDFKPYDVIGTKKPEISLKIGCINTEGWESYEVQVMKNGKPMKRFPSWNEMCEVKQKICGEDIVAFQYRIPNGVNNYAVRLWVPPKELIIPLPDSLLVGIRNEEDAKRLAKKLMGSFIKFV